MSSGMLTPLALSMPGWPEIMVILVIVLIFFGAKRLPELARGLAQSLNEFRKAKDEFDREIDRSAQDLTIKEAKDKQPHQGA
jgi:sec-independent protein translocase protein TatA